MPYITQQKRATLDPIIDTLCQELVNHAIDDPNNNTEGNLNYTITRMLKLLYGNSTVSYRDVNDIVGVLECIKLEYYRKMAAPYEDVKELENGPVDGKLEGTYLDPITVVEGTPSNPQTK
jgi:hypothetical protein